MIDRELNKPHWQVLKLLIMVVILSACGLFEKEIKDGPCAFSQHPAFKDIPRFTDFGCEYRFFVYNANMEKVPWKRNRNFVSIEFYDEMS